MTDNRLDTCLRLVSDRHRRRTIQQVRDETNGETTIDDLVDRLHSSEPVSVNDQGMDRDQLFIQLVHKHLPKLAEHGVIEYDPEREIVRYRPDEQIEAVLDSLPEDVAQVAP